MTRLRVRPPSLPLPLDCWLLVDGAQREVGSWLHVPAGVRDIELQLAGPLPAGLLAASLRCSVAVPEAADVELRLPGLLG